MSKKSYCIMYKIRNQDGLFFNGSTSAPKFTKSGKAWLSAKSAQNYIDSVLTSYKNYRFKPSTDTSWEIVPFKMIEESQVVDVSHKMHIYNFRNKLSLELNKNLSYYYTLTCLDTYMADKNEPFKEYKYYCIAPFHCFKDILEQSKINVSKWFIHPDIIKSIKHDFGFLVKDDNALMQIKLISNITHQYNLIEELNL